MTFTLIPCEVSSVIAASPSEVAGTLTNMFGSSISAATSEWAWDTVASASFATRGSTSMDTLPSTPEEAS